MRFVPLLYDRHSTAGTLIMKISDGKAFDHATCAVTLETERPDVRDLYIFIIEAEANLTMITRLHNIFSRSRIDVIDFQSVRVRDGQRVLITVRETQVTVVKLYHQLTRQVEVMSVDLFAPVDLGDYGGRRGRGPVEVRPVSPPGLV